MFRNTIFRVLLSNAITALDSTIDYALLSTGKANDLFFVGELLTTNSDDRARG
jgi:hypothetical protein